MNPALWRAAELVVPNGSIAIDIADSGRFARQIVSVSQYEANRIISSLGELREVLQQLQASAEQLARTDPLSFAYLLCVLSGRSHHVLPIDSLWTILEESFGLRRTANRPRVEAGQFIFVVCSQYMPVLTVSRITVGLLTLDMNEDTLIQSPWPASPAAVVQSVG